MRRTSGSRGFVRLGLTLALLSGGCASVEAQRATAQQRSTLLETAQHVYPLPPAQLWPRVEAYFRGQGFTLHPVNGTADALALQTDFRDAALGPGFSAQVRYHAQVQAAPHGGSLLRVFRHTVTRSQEWALLPVQQQLVTEERGEEREGEVDAVPAPLAAATLDPAAKQFGRNFFRDLGAEQALRAVLEGRAPLPTQASGIPAPDALVAQVAVALGNSLEPLPEEVKQTRCGPAIPGFDEGFDRALAPGGFLLFGEVHGTQEVPRFVGQAVCHAAHAGVPVVLALELPVREQAALNRYMASDGGPEDEAALIAGPFWRRPEQDGRSSRALVELIERARLLNRQGLPVVLMAYDVEGVQGSARDAAMAQGLLSRRRLEQRSTLLVLTGNVHASSERGVPWDEDFVPMGWHLAQAGVPFRSYDVLYRQGSAWDCRLGPAAQVQCGAHRTDPARRSRLVDGVVRSVAASGDSRPEARELEPGPGARIPSAASPAKRFSQRYQRAVQRYGPERLFVLPMAPERYPRGFDGYFYVSQVRASPPAHPALARAEAP